MKTYHRIATCGQTYHDLIKVAESQLKSKLLEYEFNGNNYKALDSGVMSRFEVEQSYFITKHKINEKLFCFSSFLLDDNEINFQRYFQRIDDTFAIEESELSKEYLEGKFVKDLERKEQYMFIF